MNAKCPFLVAILLLTFVPVLPGRIFTDKTGRTIEAEFVRASTTEVVLKVLRNQRKYRLKIATLAEADARYVARRRAEELKRLESVKRVYAFVKASLGKKVGNGQCWTLADVAYRKAEIKRPGREMRVWGGLVDWKNEGVRPGDVLELRSARFSSGMASGPEHTAVVMKVLPEKGAFVAYHQNWGPAGKTVSPETFDLNELVSGEAMVYRFGLQTD